jgi:Cys-rich repeat protein
LEVDRAATYPAFMTRYAFVSLSTLLVLSACNGSGDSVSTFDGPEPTSGGVDPSNATTSGATADTTADPTANTASNSGTSEETSPPADTTSADTGPTGCTSNDDCAGDPGGPVCNADDGACVPCTPTDDPCPEGNFCDPGSNDCVPGCANDEDCGDALVCDVATNTCVGCFADAECPLGNVCDAGTCVAGCNDMQACPDGLACCSEQCVDILTDEAHCGGCDAPCAPNNATGECSNGACGIGACDGGYEDCNGAANDGCEIDGICLCTPNAAYDCYTGPGGTQDVGICTTGTQTCNGDGTALGPCIGQVLPGAEVCNSGADENCDGTVDEDPDLDGDGWTVCGGDCCDDVGVGCLSPTLVNPGAFEFGGNLVDDDCDAVVDNVLPDCDGGIASNTAQIDNYARAIDLCQFTTLNPPNPADRVWGVISSSMTLANGANGVDTRSRSVRSGFGNVIVPQHGARLAVLSTGAAADSNDANPAFSAFQVGLDTLTNSPAPADWLAANGGVVPNAPGCAAPIDASAFNPVMLNLTVRVPTNAQSFSVDMYFFSAEYPEYVCTAFNDFFVTLLDSTNVTNPADGNLAVYDDGNNLWPVGVNLVSAANGLFTQCEDGGISQCGFGGNYNGCTGTNELAGTGFDTNIASGCGDNGRTGGGTDWLTMSGNVTPGEVVTLRFAIWDTGDGVWDSLVLLDNFTWSVNASEPGVQPG